MTLPTSGAISFSDIQTEFGGSNPIAMSEYYAGGGLVPANTGSVPSSGAITVGVFHGTSNLGPFTAGCADQSASAHSLSNDFSMTAAVVSGGPVSGNMSYAWTVTAWLPGQFASSASNLTSQTCGIHAAFSVAPAPGQQIVASLSCTVTDNVSGDQSTFTTSATFTYT